MKVIISIMLGVLMTIGIMGIGCLIIYLYNIGYGITGFFILSVIMFTWIFYKSQV